MHQTHQHKRRASQRVAEKRPREEDRPAEDGNPGDELEGPSFEKTKPGEPSMREQFMMGMAVPFNTTASYDVVKARRRTRAVIGLSKLDKIEVSQIDMVIIMIFAALVTVIAAGGAPATWPKEIMAIAATDMVKVVFEGKTGPKRSRPARACDPRFGPSIGNLHDWGIFHHVDSSGRAIPGRAFANYFEVDKSATATRSILDCRHANDEAIAPPKFKLVEPNEIIEMLCFFDWPKIASADFRHFFHQIPLSKRARSWFSVLARGVPGFGAAAEVFESWTLPMGFSWSPILAQSLSWVLATRFVSKKGEKEQFVFESPADAKTPPGYLIVRRKGTNVIVAFIIIYYDNYVVIADTKDTREKLVWRMTKNAELAGAQFKPLDKSRPNVQVQLFDDGQGDFLGIRFSRKGGRNGKLEWCHAKTDAWEDVLVAPDPCDARSLARVVGISTWDVTLRGEPMSYVSDLINVLRSKEVNKLPRKWSAFIDMSTKERELWESTMRRIMENRLTERAARPTRVHRQALLASDASDKGWGGVWMSDRGVVLGCISRKWSAEERSKSIYWREVKAAILTFEWFWSLKRVESLGIRGVRMAIDNQAARVAVSRWYSADPATNDILRPMHDELKSQEREVHTVWVGTLDQAADEPSRLVAHDDERCRRCAEILMRSPPLKHILVRYKEQMGLM